MALMESLSCDKVFYIGLSTFANSLDADKSVSIVSCTLCVAIGTNNMSTGWFFLCEHYHYLHL